MAIQIQFVIMVIQITLVIKVIINQIILIIKVVVIVQIMLVIKVEIQIIPSLYFRLFMELQILFPIQFIIMVMFDPFPNQTLLIQMKWLIIAVVIQMLTHFLTLQMMELIKFGELQIVLLIVFVKIILRPIKVSQIHLVMYYLLENLILPSKFAYSVIQIILLIVGFQTFSNII